MTTEVLSRMEFLICKGTDPKTGRRCGRKLLEVDPDHRQMVVARIRIFCHDCKTVYKE